MYRKRHKQGTIWLCNNLLTNKTAAGLTQIYHNKSRRWKPPIVMCLRHDIWAFVLTHNLIFAWIHEKIKAKIKLYKDITTKYKFCISINIPYKNIYNVRFSLSTSALCYNNNSNGKSNVQCKNIHSFLQERIELISNTKYFISRFLKCLYFHYVHCFLYNVLFSIEIKTMF